MISDTEYARAVAQFLSKKDVTRCPTACVVPTRGSVSDADRAALRNHAETREAVRQARRREFNQLVRLGARRGTDMQRMQACLP
jgi:hypothetical protein